LNNVINTILGLKWWVTMLFNQNLEIIGAWIQAVGTIITAVGYTNRLPKIEIIGDELQAVGSFLQAIGETKSWSKNTKAQPIEKTGNWMQAIGASSKAVGRTRELFKEDIENLRLAIIGSSFQSLGAFLEAVKERKDLSECEQLKIIGNSLQSLGASLGAIGGIYDLSKKNSSFYLESSGNWIQAIGANLAALGQTNFKIKKTFNVTVTN
jgi:hypothetical protein